MGDWVVESPSFIEQLMSNKIVMLNQNGVNEVVKIIEEKDKKIERLELIIKAINKYCEEHEDYEYGTLIEQLHEANIEWLRNVAKR